MKRRRSALIQLAILTALGAAVVLTLLLPQLSGLHRRPQPLELSVIIREQDSSFWTNARMGMEQAAGELGAELRFLTLSTANDGREQWELLLREIEQGADALVVAPADPAVLEKDLAELEGDVPVVTLESPLEGADLSVAASNGEIGTGLAQAALEDRKGGRVLLLDTAPRCTAVAQRLAAARDLLTEAGVETQVETIPVDSLGSRLPELLEQLSPAQVMTFEPAATEAAARVKSQEGLSVELYGVGATAAVVAALDRGTLSAVAAWSDYAAGYLAVDGAAKLARGERSEMKPPPFFLIRGEDIYEPDNQKLLFPVTS